jgi:hypothetical protein
MRSNCRRLGATDATRLTLSLGVQWRSLHKLQINRKTDDTMPLPFLVIFPREIRDQIFTYVLTNSQGEVRLYPWTVDVARSLSILRTCKQIHRECKDIIWEHNNLNIRDPCQLFQRFNNQSRLKHTGRIQHVKICLELLDRDELEWMRASLKALAIWSQTGSLKSITLVTDSDRPRTVEEFQEALVLRESGETIDGRLFREAPTWTKMFLNTGWPRFSHWGKQSWLREMLLDPSGIEALVKDIHDFFGGELFIDGILCFKDRKMIRKKMGLNPRHGEIKIILPRRSSSQNYR